MAYNTNFDLTAQIQGDTLKVTGTTPKTDVDYGFKIVSRHFILQQKKKSVMRQAQENTGNWGASKPIPSEGFTVGPALALGTETHYLEPRGAPPTFVTVTWSQAVTIVAVD